MRYTKEVREYARRCNTIGVRDAVILYDKWFIRVHDLKDPEDRREIRRIGGYCCKAGAVYNAWRHGADLNDLLWLFYDIVRDGYLTPKEIDLEFGAVKGWDSMSRDNPVRCQFRTPLTKLKLPVDYC